MPERMSRLLALCVDIDRTAIQTYKRLASEEPDERLRSCWERLAGEEEPHARYWSRLARTADEGLAPVLFDDPDQAIAELGGHVTAAITLLRGGHALPGPDAQEEHNDFRIALPSSPAAYLQLKNGAFMRAFGGFARVWGCR